MPDPTTVQVVPEHEIAAWMQLGQPAPPWQQGWFCFRCQHVHKEATRQCPQH